VFVAASAHRTSSAPEKGTHTGFTGHLVDVLDAGLPNGRPHLGLGEVFRTVTERCRLDDLPEPQILTALTEGDVDFAYNARYTGDVVVEDALVSISEKVDHLVSQLRSGGTTKLTGGVVTEIQELVKALYPRLDRLTVEVETDQGSDWPPEAIEDCIAAADGVDDAVSRHQAARRLAARRRRDVLRAGGEALRRVDDDNAVVLEGRRRIVDGLMDLRSALRALGRRSTPA